MIKILACIFMLLDHVGKVFFPDNELLQVVGRISFPLFAYSVALGLRYTSDSGRYFVRLLTVAFVAQPFYMLLFYDRLNILFTFAAIVLLFHLYKRSQLFCLLMCLPMLYLHKYYGFSYGLYGFLSVLIFYAFEGKSLLLSFSFIALNVLFAFPGFLGFFDPEQLLSVAALPLLLRNIELVKIVLHKYFYYAFYPAHLAVLVLIRGLL